MPKISQARKDERRGQILVAAMRCFARQGFHTTTIHDICAEAALSIGAVYSYFDGKDAIIAALSEAGQRATGEHIEVARRGGSPLEQLRGVLSALERPDSLTLHQLDVRSWAEAIGEPALREGYLGSQAAVTAMLAEIVRPLAIAKGIAPEALAQLIAATTIGAMVRRAIQPSTDLEPMLRALITLLQPQP